METPRDTQNTASAQESLDKIKVSDIRSRHSSGRFQGRYVFEDFKNEGEILCEWEIRPEVVGFNVLGWVQGDLTLECARCLEPFHVPVSLKIDERYVYDSYVDPNEREKELKSDDFFEVASVEGELDLKDLVHQFLILESETQPTCGRAECAFMDGDPLDE